MNYAADLERLSARVRAAAHDGGLIETAQVKLVGLDEIRIAAGPRWPRMREHVREGSLKIIASRIGAEDAVVACGDGYLVVFADAASEDTKRVCAEIHDALIAFYLGEDALKALRAEVQRESASAASLAGVVADAAEPKHLKSQRSELNLGRFWPVWSMRLQIVAAHICAPAIERGKAPARIGYAADFLDKANHIIRDYLDLDLCLLEQACAAAMSPDSTPVGVSVHVTTMQNRRARTTYLTHAAANAANIGQRMFVTIAEIEPGTPLMSLTEWRNELKHTFPRVALDLHHSDRAIGSLAATGAWAAGYHLPHPRHSGSAEVRATLNNLDSWCRALRRQGLQSWISGFADSGLLDLATYSDLALASGALWQGQSAPTRSSVLTHSSAHAALAP
jgi:hypothetical protein